MGEMTKRKHQPLRISRRTFIQASGVTGLTLVAAGSVKAAAASLFESPQEPELPVNQGVVSEEWVNTSCLNCPARCATSVRVVNGKAVRITGNQISQVSEGQICPRGHIGLQVLYDSARITIPLKRTNSNKSRTADPGWKPISWEDALNEVSARLTALRSGGTPERLALFSGLNTRSDEDLIARFAEAYGTPNLVSGDSLENEAERMGRWLADGNYSHIAYDLGRANYVLAFGASIVESERPLARNLRMWGKMRRERPTRGKVITIDPRYSVTAAKSDQWLPINPGTDAALALAIANVIITEELYDRDFVSRWTAGFDAFRTLAIGSYSPESVQTTTGIKAGTIRQLARDFATTKPALAWVGRGVAGWPNGTLTAYAIYCLNALVGAIDAPGGVIYQDNPAYTALPELTQDAVARAGLGKTRLDGTSPKALPAQEMAINRAADAIRSGQPYSVGMAIGFNSNFNMTAPGAARWDEALGKVPYYVHVAPFLSEMALGADLVLPATTFLEQWGYDHSPPGSGFVEVKIKQPVVELKSDVRSAGQIIFDLARKMGGQVGGAFDGIGGSDEGFVRFRTEALVSWNELTDKGVWTGPPYEYGKLDSVLKTETGKFELVSGRLQQIDDLLSASVSLRGAPRHVAPAFLGDEKDFPFVLTTYQPVLTMETGSQNYAWAQEVFLAMHGLGWNSFVELNAETARELGINNLDDVWLESTFGRLKAKARVTEWLKPDVVAVARGQGHYAPGEWQKGIGVNPNDIVGVDYDRLSGQSALYNTRVRVYRA